MAKRIKRAAKFQIDAMTGRATSKAGLRLFGASFSTSANTLDDARVAVMDPDTRLDVIHAGHWNGYVRISGPKNFKEVHLVVAQ